LKNVIEIQIEPRLRKAKGATSPFKSNSRILDRKPLDGVGTAGRAGDRCWQSLQSSRNKTQQQQQQRQRQQRQQQQQQVPEIKSSSPPPPPQCGIAERNGFCLCLSRACLGKMIVLYINGSKMRLTYRWVVEVDADLSLVSKFKFKSIQFFQIINDSKD
jgi:hypothetical protein